MQVAAYLDNELSLAERTAFEQALVNNAQLQKEFNIQKELWNKLRALQLKKKADALIKMATEIELSAKETPSLSVVRTRWLKATAYGLTACLALFIFKVLLYPPNPPVSPNTDFNTIGANKSNEIPAIQTESTSVLLKTPIKKLIPKNVFLQRIENQLHLKNNTNVIKLVNQYYTSDNDADNIRLEEADKPDDAAIAVLWLLKAIYNSETFADPQRVKNCLKEIPADFFAEERFLYQNIFDAKTNIDAKQRVEQCLSKIQSDSLNLHFEKAKLFSDYIHQK